MRIETEVKLDFKDVLIRPKRSRLATRAGVEVTREHRFPHSDRIWSGVPIIAANMDTVGTFEMAEALAGHGLMTALHKFHELDALGGFFSRPHVSDGHDGTMRDSSFFSIGITEQDLSRLDAIMAGPDEARPHFVCLDVANGYSERFTDTVRRIRDRHPDIVLMAGNVVTGEMTEELVLSGADIVKVGIGPGSVCTTRKMTGVGYPQLSAVIECADAAHGLKGLVCADGGCTVPGDIAKAFAGGADFVMLGGMLAGHDENAGTLITRHYLTDEIDEAGERVIETRKFVEFYGMSSDTAMSKHYGGVAEYRASEGKRVELPYRGSVHATVSEILGGLRSTCTYVGAHRLKELSKRTTFVRVTQQINEVFGKAG